MKKLLLPSIIALGISLTSLTSFAEQSVIVHPDNNSTTTAKDIKRLYLAKMKSFPGGSLALPLNHKDASDARKTFDKKLVKKSPSQMKSYWAKLVFTGKATPLKQVDNDDDILELVSINPSAIGYIDSSKVTDKVKVIHTF